MQEPWESVDAALLEHAYADPAIQRWHARCRNFAEANPEFDPVPVPNADRAAVNSIGVAGRLNRDPVADGCTTRDGTDSPARSQSSLVDAYTSGPAAGSSTWSPTKWHVVILTKTRLTRLTSPGISSWSAASRPDATRAASWLLLWRRVLVLHRGSTPKMTASHEPSSATTYCSSLRAPVVAVMAHPNHMSIRRQRIVQHDCRGHASPGGWASLRITPRWESFDPPATAALRSAILGSAAVAEHRARRPRRDPRTTSNTGADLTINRTGGPAGALRRRRAHPGKPDKPRCVRPRTHASCLQPLHHPAPTPQARPELVHTGGEVSAPSSPRSGRALT